MGFDEFILNSIGDEAMFVMHDYDTSITVDDIISDIFITSDCIYVTLENGSEITIGDWKTIEEVDNHYCLPNRMEIFFNGRV